MDGEHVKAVSLKFLVDKKSDTVILAESDEDFVDTLFSFLTLPMGTIIRRTRDIAPTEGLGCMNNLYESVESLDVQRFRTEAGKTMLLYPRNVAEAECRKLKLNIDDSEPLKYFLCSSQQCRLDGGKLLSHYKNTICSCGKNMDFEQCLSEMEYIGHSSYKVVPKRTCIDAGDEGVFVKDLTRFVISRKLEVMPASTQATFYLLSDLGVIDRNNIEERNITVGAEEVLTLLKYSLVSKTALTETLLKHRSHSLEPEFSIKNDSAPELRKEDFGQANNSKSTREEQASTVDGGICVKLVVSKSKNMVCYAEASDDFVDLLFSFLCVPLGYIANKMRGTSKRCITHLCNSVEKLDAEQCLKSCEHNAMLLNPKLAPDFGYKNHPLGIEEDKHPPFNSAKDRSNLKLEFLTITSSISHAYRFSVLTVVDPKSRVDEVTSGRFVRGPTKFIVMDNLIITPMSSVSCLYYLNDLKVPLNDVKECDVHVGSVEALRLLLASLESESALTNTFLREPNQNIEEMLWWQLRAPL